LRLKKNFIIISFLLLNAIASATNYYVSSSGNDSNNGLSSSTPWKTIAKVNASSFATGDSIFFKRGDVWREQIVPKSGSISKYLYYGAFGSGAKPLFLGSVQGNSTSDWVNVGTNLWQNSNAAFSVDVGNIIFNNEKSCGVKIMSQTPAFTTQGQFWYDFVNRRIIMYSVGNPATFYTDIECALRKDAIYPAYDVNYVTFQNLDFRYWGACVNEDIGSYINFLDLDLSYIGGGDLENNYGVRFGNGLQMWNGKHDITIERCRIDNIYDAGISPQGSGTGYEVYNIYMRNNIISNCEYSFEFWERDGSSSAHNIYFENNTCVNAGGGWGHNQRTDGLNGRHIMIFSNTALTNNIYIRNNIFYNATESLIDIIVASDVSDIVIDYNDLYQSSGYIGTIQYTDYSSLANWKTASNQDAHSISGNPIFLGTTDFHLQSSSPAIDAGLDVGLPYSGNAPDIGAFETQLIPNVPLPVYVNSVIENATPTILKMTYNLSLANIVPTISAFTVLVNSTVRTVSAVSISGTNVLLTLSSPVVNGNVVTVAYTKPATNPLQSTSGGQAATINAQTVTNNVVAVTVTPTYVSSSIVNASPSVLTMIYSTALANIVPAASAFTVRVNSATRSVTAVSVSGTNVLLTLSSPVVNGNVVTVAYTKPATYPLQSTSGGQAATISAQTVTNNVSPVTVTPAYVSSSIDNASPAVLTMTFSTILASIVPAASAFTVTVNSAVRTVTAVSVSGTYVLLTLSSPAVNGNVVTVAYSKPATNPLQSTSGGQAATISAQTVINNVGAVIVTPTYVSSSIVNTSPSVLTMTYSTALASIVPAASAFAVKVNSAARTVTAVSVSGTNVLLTLSSPVVNGNVVTVAYTKPATNPLQSTTGGKAATISAQTVTNNVNQVNIANPVSPNYISSVIENVTPDLLKITFDINLANIVPATSTFTVIVNSIVRTVNTVSISDNNVLLTLSSPVVFGDDVTVEYVKPFSNPLQSNDGGLVSDITSQSVSNNCIELPGQDLGDNLERKILIYPNPASDSFNISVQGSSPVHQTLKIIDLSGKIVYTESINQNISNVQIPENINSGLYIVTLETGGIILDNQKLIIYK
jgi:uncharacterized repeat protein (TIGR02059 family)